MKFRIIIYLLFVVFSATAQQNKDILNYITQYKHVAIDEMVRTGIPASITLAQGILESGCGKSPLSQIANNHFGIKCKTEWTGERYYQDDDEAQECFRVYEHAEASYVDHSDFLLTRYWYAALFRLPSIDYKSWAYGLKAVGYATNPNYANILITHIENYNLHQLDIIAMELMEEKNRLLGFSEQPELASKYNTAAIEERQTHQTRLLNASAEDSRTEFLVNGVRATHALNNEDPISVAVKYKMDYSAIVMFNDLPGGGKFKRGENIFLEPKKTKGEEATYIVLPGETMRDISQRLGMRLKDLYSLNQMKMDDQPYPTETLHLRTRRIVPPRVMSYEEYLETQNRINSATTSTNVVASSNINSKSGTRYEVQKSDTLYSIAQKFNVSVKQLQDVNNLGSTLLKPGQILLVSK